MVETEQEQLKPCDTCNGKGKNTRGQRCLDCNGTGKMPEIDEDLQADLNAVGLEVDEGFEDEFEDLSEVPDDDEVEEL